MTIVVKTFTVADVAIRVWKHCGRSLICLLYRCPSRTVGMFGGASCDSSGQPNEKCAGSSHTADVDVARNGSIENDDRMSGRVIEDVGALTRNTGWDSDCGRDDLLGDVVESVSTMLEVLLYELPLPNLFAVAYWFLAFDDFALPF